jgi:transcriptional antiterminator NusG
MDINENEEQIEELEPIADTAELVGDPVDDNQAPADEEPATLPDQDPPVDEEEDQEESLDGEVFNEILEEQSSADVLPDAEPVEDLEVEVEELEELASEVVESDEDELEVILEDTEDPVEIDSNEELEVEVGGSDEPVLEEEPVPEVIESDEEETDVIHEDTEASVEIESEHDDADPYRKHILEIEPAIDDGRAWYVVHCYSGNEDKVRHNIMQRIESMTMDDLIFDVVVPTEDEVNIKNGERQTVEKKVFPGYILVNMILTEESWYMVRNTPGVTGFVGMGNDPTPLQPEEVARILKRMESESPRINVTFRPGERVRIVDGPFEDFYGKVAEIDMDRATVRVMVNFFGRETPVELDFLQVEEA